MLPRAYVTPTYTRHTTRHHHHTRCLLPCRHDAAFAALSLFDAAMLPRAIAAFATRFSLPLLAIHYASAMRAFRLLLLLRYADFSRHDTRCYIRRCCRQAMVIDTRATQTKYERTYYVVNTPRQVTATVTDVVGGRHMTRMSSRHGGSGALLMR